MTEVNYLFCFYHVLRNYSMLNVEIRPRLFLEDIKKMIFIIKSSTKIDKNVNFKTLAQSS